MRTLFAGGAVVLAAGLFTAPVIGDGVNDGPDPATPRIASSVPATAAQVAGSTAPLNRAAVSAVAKRRTSKAGRKVVIRKRVVTRTVTVQSRITTTAITTEENHGSFVGIRCPAGSKAISGGIISNFINLLLSSSAPNNPVTGRYTPRTWWVSVTNSNIDGNGGTLSWRGVVNCLSPIRIGK